MAVCIVLCTRSQGFIVLEYFTAHQHVQEPCWDMYAPKAATFLASTAMAVG